MRSRISSIALLVLVSLAISTHAGAQTNQPPTISGAPPSTAIVRQTYHFLPSATDPEGMRLSWSIANKPAWAAFSATTGRLTGAPGYSHIGTLSNIVITVSDGSQSASLPPFSITVSTAGGNSPPVISGAPPTTATARQTYHFLPSGSDPDGQKLTWSISNRPAWASFSTTTGRLTGAPGVSHAGTTVSDIVISASDGSQSASLPPFSITVSTAASSPPPSPPPSVSITTPQQLPAGTAGTTYSVTLAATGGTTPYRWQVASGSLLPSALALDPVTGVISGTPANASTASFGITVMDANAVSVNATFSLTINASGTAPPGWQLSWSDEFNGTGAVDPATWRHEIGMVRNNEAQYYTDRLENIRQENGMLVIEGRKEAFNGAQYTSASIRSDGRRQFLYGRLEVRAQLPGGRGTWPAFWTMGVSGGWPLRGEIDIMENVGFDQNTVHNVVHTGSGSSMGSTHVSNPHQGFHVYSLEWYADRLDFLIDGVKTFTYTNDGRGDVNSWPFSAPQYMLLNLAIGGSWGGQQGIDDSIFPARYYIDYVRYYTRQ